ncbi:Uncharacterised protein [Porphyromonas macacae]|uniref:Uncharacterized protein n=1 Tax=Porphyromonas macacae TaxID=28115 RepID=A0A379EBF5_9PORP|nr:Uncharacterised protein [Porphyromonas macacae]
MSIISKSMNMVTILNLARELNLGFFSFVFLCGVCRSVIIFQLVIFLYSSGFFKEVKTIFLPEPYRYG